MDCTITFNHTTPWLRQDLRNDPSSLHMLSGTLTFSSGRTAVRINGDVIILCRDLLEIVCSFAEADDGFGQLQGDNGLVTLHKHHERIRIDFAEALRMDTSQPASHSAEVSSIHFKARPRQFISSVLKAIGGFLIELSAINSRLELNPPTSDLFQRFRQIKTSFESGASTRAKDSIGNWLTSDPWKTTALVCVVMFLLQFAFTLSLWRETRSLRMQGFATDISSSGADKKDNRNVAEMMNWKGYDVPAKDGKTPPRTLSDGKKVVTGPPKIPGAENLTSGVSARLPDTSAFPGALPPVAISRMLSGREMSSGAMVPPYQSGLPAVKLRGTVEYGQERLALLDSGNGNTFTRKIGEPLNAPGSDPSMRGWQVVAIESDHVELELRSAAKGGKSTIRRMTLLVGQ